MSSRPIAEAASQLKARMPRLTEEQRRSAREASAARDAQAVRSAMEGVRRQLLARCGVPRAFRQPARAPQGAELAEKLLGGGLWCAYLWGAQGRGKTDLTCACVLHAVRRGVPARFVGDAEMLGQIRSAADDPADSQEAAVARLCRVELLAIDDLGKSRLTEWGAEQLWRVIDGRWREGRATVITSNMARDQLGAWIAGVSPTLAWPILSRLSDRCEAVEMTGPDYRLERGA